MLKGAMILQYFTELDIKKDDEDQLGIWKSGREASGILDHP